MAIHSIDFDFASVRSAKKLGLLSDPNEGICRTWKSQKAQQFLALSTKWSRLSPDAYVLGDSTEVPPISLIFIQ